VRTYPSTDQRGVAALRDYLGRLASALTPGWTPTGEHDDVGSALLQIGARLASETTQRLNRTAQRDAMAFFDFLGLPPTPPRAATGTLVMTLADNHPGSVSAAARVQLAAGSDVPFETQQELRVVPGRIGDLLAVDTAKDRIEQAPAEVSRPAPPAVQPAAYQVLTFAASGSPTLQLSPAVGLSAGDLIRVEHSAYRVATADKNGLVTLQDPLEAAAASTTVTKIASLETSTLRNLQNHAFYIGHKELLTLDQKAVITIALAPTALARELARLDLAYAMYGTPEGEDQPGWQPLDLIGTEAGRLHLAKSWVGTTGDIEVAGRKSRWVRIVLKGPVSGRRSLTARASRVQLGVKSLLGDAASDGSGSSAAKGSATIAQAAHNGTALSTAGRFLPFGPEPLRFETFALAAPEALSKKGAVATVHMTLADASLASFRITVGALPGDLGGYGSGANGYLEVLSPEADGHFRWQELPLADRDGQRLLLATPPVGVQLADPGVDLVVITDQAGGVWAARLTRASSTTAATVSKEGWQEVLALPGGSGNPVAVPAPAGAPGVAVVLFDVADGSLHALPLNEYGPYDAARWQPVRPQGGTGPTFAGTWQVVPVQAADWPARPAGTAVEIVVVDGVGTLWLGTVGGIAPGETVTASWHRFDAAAAAAEVAPAATRFPVKAADAALWIAYAARGDQTHQVRALCGLVHGADGTREVGVDATVGLRQSLYSDPGVAGIDGHPVTVGLADAPGQVLVWLGADRVRRIPLGTGTASAGPLLVRTAATAPAQLILPVSGERLYRTQVDLPIVEYSLHDAVVVSDKNLAHWLEISRPPGDLLPSPVVRLGTPRIPPSKGPRVYQVDEPHLQTGLTVRALRLRSPSGGAFAGHLNDPNDRTALSLDATDKVTQVGDRLVIAAASFPVMVISAARVATLGFPVPGTDPTTSYQPTRELTSYQVTAVDVRTLAELRPGGIAEASGTLDFGAPADPPTQQLRSSQLTSGTLWALLKDGWTQPPPDQGKALVADEGPSTATWAIDAFERGYQNPELSWEYFDGQGWRALDDLVDGTANLSTSGTVQFTVPKDLSTTEIGGKQNYWIRARLVGGDYGRPKYVVDRRDKPDGSGDVQTVTVDTSALRPPEILAIEAGFDLKDQRAPQIVLVENNLDTLDETEAASDAAARFELFQGVLALDPEAGGRALYVGLTKAIGGGSATLLADAADQDGDGRLRVDVRTADAWQPVLVDDRTHGLRRRGMITLTLESDPIVVRLFGRERVWLRLRPDPDDASWAPVVRRLLVNAVPITQARTVPNEIVGSSLGEPVLTLGLAEVPVLPETVELRVREDLSDEDTTQLEGRYPGEAVVRSNVDGLPGSWVLWHRVDSLIGSDGDARVYVLDPGSGRVRFGNGRAGRIPPAGRDNIRCFTYQQGGGGAGNLPAWSPVRLTSAVEGVETVVLPLDTAGGYGAPSADSLFATAPDRLRHGSRAVSPADVEALAVASSADVVRARCARPDAPGDPIGVTIAVRGNGAARCPQPTLAQREDVVAAIRAQGWGGLGENGISVHGPVYVSVAVTARVIARPDRVAEVEHAAKDALVLLLDPVLGGRDGAGWPFGRRPTEGDLLRVLDRVPGLDRVLSVDITAPGGGRLQAVPLDGLVCAELGDIHLVVADPEATS
jgi:hypothetical protein